MLFQGRRDLSGKLHLQSGETPILTFRRPYKFNIDKATTYVFKEFDTIDYVAYKIYGDSRLYWAILDANPQYQSELEIQVGDVLVVPSYDEVVTLSGK